jgi:hypothetical protein
MAGAWFEASAPHNNVIAFTCLGLHAYHDIRTDILFLRHYICRCRRFNGVLPDGLDPNVAIVPYGPPPILLRRDSQRRIPLPTGPNTAAPVSYAWHKRGEPIPAGWEEMYPENNII